MTLAVLDTALPRVSLGLAVALLVVAPAQAIRHWSRSKDAA